MKTAVWDTYVKRKNGNVMHFDILVPDSETDAQKIFGYGKKYLVAQQEPDGVLDVQQCQYCHVEETTQEMKDAFATQGYFILDLGEIPSVLPSNPSRRDMILHLRAHYAEYRFADFREKTTEEISAIIQGI